MKRTLSLLGCLLLLSGCMEGAKPTPLRRATLRERLGGDAAIARIADDLARSFLADERMSDARRRMIQKEHPPDLNERLRQVIAEVGGEAGANSPLLLSDGEFTILLHHLEAALESHGVGQRERKELLAGLARKRPLAVAKNQ